MLLSATLIKIGTILISIAFQFRKIGDPTDAKLMKLSLLSKLKQDKSTSAKEKQKSIIDDMQRFLDVIYGKVFSTRAFGRVLLGSLSISFLFYLWLGVYLFGDFSGLITIFSWPKIVMYFAWTSIVVSLVSLLDITLARAILQRLNLPNIRLPIKLMLVGILFAIAGFSFILATAVVSGTAINSWNLLKGDLSGVISK